MFLIDRQNKKATSLNRETFKNLELSERDDLQEWIADNPEILGEKLLIIQKEFDGFSDTNERLDLLALDKSGKIVVIENKLDDSGKDVVWQALKYVSYCATLTKSEICDIYQRYLGKSGNASEKITKFLGEQDYESIQLNTGDSDQRIILVAANYRKEVTSTVLWLQSHEVDITCIKVIPYKYGDELFLDVEQILPTKDIGDYQIRRLAKSKEETIETSRHRLRYRFWEKALPVMREKTGIYHNVLPSKANWLNGASGHSGITFNPIILYTGARTELYIDTGNDKKNEGIFRALKARKDEIESSFGGNLDWQELPGKRACRICVHFEDYGLTDEENWDEIIDFLADTMARLKTALQPLLDTIVKG